MWPVDGGPGCSGAPIPFRAGSPPNRRLGRLIDIIHRILIDGPFCHSENEPKATTEDPQTTLHSCRGRGLDIRNA